MPQPQLQFIWRDASLTAAPNTWTWFRREFDWKPGQSAKIHFAADPTARLYINGHVVLTRVMRFVSPHITVEPIDLTPYLREGGNVAVVLHHYWGVPTFQRSAGGRPGIAIAGDCLSTEDSWDWCEASEFLHHPHQTLGNDTQRIRFPVVMDTAKSLRQLHATGSRLKSFKSAVPVEASAWSDPTLKETAALERKATAPTGVTALGYLRRPDGIAPHPKTPMSWEAKHATYTPSKNAVIAAEALLETDAAKNSARLDAKQDGYLTLDFGKPLHGFLRIEIESAPKGATLDFLYGELREDLHSGKPVLHPDGSFDPELIVGAPYGDRVILRGGSETVEIPDERTLRWLLLTWKQSSDEIRIRRVTLMSCQHPAPELGTFAGGPRSVPNIISLCIDHARVTMSDAYVDTPGREDGQWLEDIQYRARLAATWFGDYSLRQVTLRHAVEQQAANGRFRVFPPEDYMEQGAQCLDWGMAWIGILRDDWMWTGQTKRVRAYFKSLQRFLDAAHRQTNGEGMLVDRTCFSDIRCALRPNHNFGEMESITNAWYHGFLLQAATLAEAVNKKRQANLWRERAAALRKGFRRFLAPGDRVAEIWSPHEGLRGYGQAAAVCAVYHGLLDERTAGKVLRTAFPKANGSPPKNMRRWNNPTYFYRALRVLCAHGLGETAGRHFVERFAPYLPDGPLPEYFILGEGQPKDPTGSHGWAAVPLAWLHDTVLGLRLADPGGAKLTWNPINVGWSKVSGTVMTPRGPCQVAVDWKKRSFTIDPPKGVEIEPNSPLQA